jgi:hypothetical protein
MITLEVGSARIQVPRVALIQTCRIPPLHGDEPSYRVRSDVSPEIIQAFVGLINGQEINITRDNFTALMQLDTEFDCPALAAKLAMFSKSLPERMHQLMRTFSQQFDEMTSRLSSMEKAQSEQRRRVESEEQYRRGRELLSRKWHRDCSQCNRCGEILSTFRR